MHPAYRQGVQRTSLRSAQGGETAHPSLGKAAYENVRERSGRLTVARGGDFYAVNKMQIEVRVGAQGKEVVIIFSARSGGDGDVGGLCRAGSQQTARPANRFDGFVISRRR